LIRSARDIADGGIATALAQATFEKGIGAKVEQEQSLMTYPLFGLFAEPSSTVLVSTVHENIGDIEKLASQFSYFCARIGTTGGARLEISVYGDLMISAPISEFRGPWENSLQAALHNEVTA
jgi:phosphoribosylformylglycinamidine synthase